MIQKTITVETKNVRIRLLSKMLGYIATTNQHIGFRSDSEGIYVPDFMIQGMLRTTAETLQSNLKNKISQFLFIYPRKIYLGKLDPNNVYKQSIKLLTTPGGPREIIRCTDFIDVNTEIEFQMKLISNKHITWDFIQCLLDYGKNHGLHSTKAGELQRGIWQEIESEEGSGKFEVIEFSDSVITEISKAA